MRSNLHLHRKVGCLVFAPCLHHREVGRLLQRSKLPRLRPRIAPAAPGPPLGPDYTTQQWCDQLLKNVPIGVRICLIDGIKGAGSHTISRALKAFAITHGVPAIELDTSSFVEQTFDCRARIDNAFNSPCACDVWNRDCFDCPKALKTDCLYPHIFDLAVTRTIPTETRVFSSYMVDT